MHDVVRIAVGLVLAVVASLVSVASAREAAPAADDPVLEARMARITAELRCLVCQNQTIAESDAGLAVDLRRETRAMLKAGKSEDEVLAYMTDRYGDFVRYRPPVKTTTALLWFGPALLLVGGAVSLAIVLRRRQRLGDEAFDPEPIPDADVRTDAIGAAAAAAAGAAGAAADAPGRPGR
jgi:cytochrome c-type biogenesis protein CcmH